MITLHVNERKLPWMVFRSIYDCASSVLISDKLSKHFNNFILLLHDYLLVMQENR